MRVARIAVLSTVLLLPACGWFSYEKSSPDDIAEDVAAAMSDVSSMRFEGTHREDGTTYELDLAVAKNGNCKGSISIRRRGGFELVVKGGDGFIKPDRRFWRNAGPRADALIGQVGDRWVATTGDLAQVPRVCDWKKLTGGFDSEEDADITKVTGPGDIHGQETVRVEFTTPEGGDGVGHVLASDPHYLVSLRAQGQGELTLSEFNEPVRPKVPRHVVQPADIF